jgi:hypothetical protein
VREAEVGRRLGTSSGLERDDQDPISRRQRR